jgi:hypothetical protein
MENGVIVELCYLFDKFFHFHDFLQCKEFIKCVCLLAIRWSMSL